MQLAASRRRKRSRRSGALVHMAKTWKPKRPPDWYKHSRTFGTFGDASCSNSSRTVRGGIGFLLGAALGGMVGGGVALAITTTQFEVSAPVEAVKRIKTTALIAAGITVVGAVGGLYLGAAKPEC